MSIPRNRILAVSIASWLIAAVLIALLLSGCAMTPRMHMYAGRALDFGTTYYALEIDGGYSEANPLADDMTDVLLLNIVAIGIYELGAWLMDRQEDKNACYWIGAAGGYGFGAYNAALLLSD